MKVFKNLTKSLLALVFILAIADVWGQNHSITWRSESNNGNWEYGSNCNGENSPSDDYHWWDLTDGVGRNRPDCSGNYNDVFFNNDVQTTSNLNSGTSYNIRKIFFQSGSTTGRIFNTDNSLTLNFYESNSQYPLIANNSGNNAGHTFNVVINLNATSELKPEDGDLTFNNTINNNGNNITVKGNNSKHLIINDPITGGGKFILNENSIVEFHDTNTYTGNTELDNGELWLYNNNAIHSSSNIYLGNGTQTSNTTKIFLANSTGGMTISNDINVNNGNTGTRYIGSLNSSGVNELSGNIINSSSSDLNIEVVSSGGHMLISGAIDNGAVKKIGAGSLTLSSSNTYTGNTTVEVGSLEVSGSITSETAQINVNNTAELIVSGYAKANTLSVASGATVTVKSGATLYIKDAITNEGTIVVENTGSIIQDGGINSGGGTYEIHKTTSPYNQYDYTYFSSPVTNIDIATALTAFDLKYQYIASNFKDLYSDITGGGIGFPQTEGNPDSFDDAAPWDWQSASGSMTPGVGYIARGPVEATSGTSVLFSDSGINNGAISVTIDKDAYTVVGSESPAILQSNNNANLIGNPFPSAIQLTTFYQDADNSDKLTGDFYFWTHNTAISGGTPGPWASNYNANDFATYNAVGAGAGTQASTGGAIPSGFVSSCQGFIAAMDENFGSSTATITFKNSHRTTGNNNQFFKASEQDLDRIRLTLLTEAGESRPILVGFEDGASDDYDAYDSPRMENGLDANDFFSYASEENNLKLVIQRLSPFTIDKIVPLGIEIYESGTHSISIYETTGVFKSSQPVYIKDYQTGSLHNLSTPYIFEITNNDLGDIFGRWELRFVDDTTGIDESALENLHIYPNPSNGQFYFNWQGTETLDVQVFDIHARLVYTKSLTKGDSINMSHVQSGIYLAKIQVNGQQIVKKLVVR